VGIDIDSMGKIYVADTWNHRIQTFDSAFFPLMQWPVEAWYGKGALYKPSLVVGDQGYVFVSDPEGDRIIVYNSGGQVITVWGRLYAPEPIAFSLPLGLDLYDQRYLFVADSNNNRIVKLAVQDLD
jgi:sugar lactone lactonase YvrE